MSRSPGSLLEMGSIICTIHFVPGVTAHAFSRFDCVLWQTLHNSIIARVIYKGVQSLVHDISWKALTVNYLVPDSCFWIWNSYLGVEKKFGEYTRVCRLERSFIDQRAHDMSSNTNHLLTLSVGLSGSNSWFRRRLHRSFAATTINMIWR